jgi:hypothetical protein
MYRFLLATLVIVIILFSCTDETKNNQDDSIAEQSIKVDPPKPKVIKEYEMVLSDYLFTKDTVRKGDFFGSIMDKNGVLPTKVYEITNQIPDTIFNFRRINGYLGFLRLTSLTAYK